jgi:hypothetical protein
VGIRFLGPTKKYIGGGRREMALGSILDVLEVLHLGRLGMILDHEEQERKIAIANVFARNDVFINGASSAIAMCKISLFA